MNRVEDVDGGKREVIDNGGGIFELVVIPSTKSRCLSPNVSKRPVRSRLVV